MTWPRARADSYIGVVGPGVATADEERHAYAVGRGLAERGVVVVCGGLSGVMHAAARGGFEAGGTTVGLLPGADRSEGNPYLSVVLATGLGELRNGLLVAVVDGLIAIGSSWGTMNELALAMRSGKPVVRLGGWKLASEDGSQIPFGSTADTALAAITAVLDPTGH